MSNLYLQFGITPTKTLLDGLKALVPEGESTNRAPVRLRIGSAQMLGEEITWTDWREQELFVQLGWDQINQRPKKRRPKRHEQAPSIVATNGSAEFAVQSDLYPDFPNCWASEGSGGRGYLLQIDPESLPCLD